MRVCFIDPSGLDYTVDTPYTAPLGGSQSALCYLAEALALAGAVVTVINSTSTVGAVRGVEMVNSKAVTLDRLSANDVIVLLNNPKVGVLTNLRRQLGPRPLMLVWTGHAPDQPAVEQMADRSLMTVLDSVMYCSRWQAAAYERAFGIPGDKAFVLPYAIGPAFENRFAPGESILAAKARPPVMTYTSTPFRGLNILLATMPAVVAAHPEVTLEVYSSMQTYQIGGEQDTYRALYDACRQTRGVNYIGSVPQPQLADRMRAIAIMSYPSTFAETFCIAALEALASGCMVVTSDLGALPETMGGLAELVPLGDDAQAFAQAYAERLVRTLGSFAHAPAMMEARLRHQVDHLNATATWRSRARDFTAWVRNHSR